MHRNGRKIALGLIVIVLGAGVLLKIIPPETDVGINDRHLVNIDGTLVTNPLDLSETIAPKIPDGLSTLGNLVQSPAAQPVEEPWAPAGEPQSQRRFDAPNASLGSVGSNGKPGHDTSAAPRPSGDTGGAELPPRSSTFVPTGSKDNSGSAGGAGGAGAPGGAGNTGDNNTSGALPNDGKTDPTGSPVNAPSPPDRTDSPVPPSSELPPASNDGGNQGGSSSHPSQPDDLPEIPAAPPAGDNEGPNVSGDPEGIPDSPADSPISPPLSIPTHPVPDNGSTSILVLVGLAAISLLRAGQKKAAHP